MEKNMRIIVIVSMSINMNMNMNRRNTSAKRMIIPVDAVTTMTTRIAVE